MFLFFTEYMDLLLLVVCILLLMSVFILIIISNYHIKKVSEMERQIDYWRQQALSAKHRDEEL